METLGIGQKYPTFFLSDPIRCRYFIKIYVSTRYLHLYEYVTILYSVYRIPFIGRESVFCPTILARCSRYIHKVAASHEFVFDRPIGRLAIYSKYPATIIKFVLNDRYGYHLATISSRHTNGIGSVRELREVIGSWSSDCVFSLFPLSGSRIRAKLHREYRVYYFVETPYHANCRIGKSRTVYRKMGTFSWQHDW